MRFGPKQLTVCIVLLVSAPLALAAGPAKRARPPRFSEAVSDAFFPNALEKLVGPRPQRVAAPDATPPITPTPTDAPATIRNDAHWPALVDVETLEDEIKAQQRALGLAVQSPLEFKGGDYQEARLRLSLLAAMFAIAAEYGQPVRWQTEAAAMRDQLAKAAANCKVGTDASFQDAKARFDDLQTLLRGESVDLPGSTDEPRWPNIADRAMLMKRLEQALDAGLSPQVANAKSFAAATQELTHESQIVAALAAVIAAEGYEFADDEAYGEWATAMQSHAAAASQAIAEKNYEAARQAVGEISKSCASCHESFRN
jgi:cytochrome c556